IDTENARNAERSFDDSLRSQRSLRSTPSYLDNVPGTPLAGTVTEVEMADDDEMDDMTVVPLPSEEDEAERERIRRSNDRDQELEREGKPARHNQGYDEAADGTPAPDIE